ncbi:hypothetical protein ES705_51006 [subsurface metagenome]
MKAKPNTIILKKLFLFILPFLLLNLNLLAQEETEVDFKPSGQAFGKVFWNYNYKLSGDANKKSSFALQRAYLGYKYQFSENISAKITLDGARFNDDTEGIGFTVILKHAQLDWKVAEPVKLSLGLIGLNQFSDQEKFWGY